MRRDTQITRQLLIDTAEKLFAEKGLESTSLFDVLKASGLKNRSALQYHFRNKEGLINAVLNKHALGVAERRAEMIQVLEQQLEQQHAPSLQQVVEVIVAPMAEKLNPRKGGREFLKIHSQLMVSEPFNALRMARPERKAEGQKIRELLTPFIQDLSQDSLSSRMALVDCLLIHGLARYFTLEKGVSRRIFHQTLVQTIVDLISQPEAKEQGRNRVVVYEGEPELPSQPSTDNNQPE